MSGALSVSVQYADADFPPPPARPFLRGENNENAAALSGENCPPQNCESQNCAPPRGRVRALLRSALPDGGEITVRFVAAEEMARLNLQYRQKTGASDVLSFAYHSPGAPVLGDIAVCPAEAAKTARRRGLSAAAHLSHLIVHGALHLAGEDHGNARAAGKMEQTEREILARFGIPDPYLITENGA